MKNENEHNAAIAASVDAAINTETEVSDSATPVEYTSGISAPRAITDHRKDIRLPLEPELFLDLQKIAKILKMSRIALLTQYVMDGYRKDIHSNQQLFQSRGFQPEYLTVSNSIQSITSGVANQSLPEEIAAALNDGELKGGTKMVCED